MIQFISHYLLIIIKIFIAMRKAVTKLDKLIILCRNVEKTTAIYS
jgi:hypothetical protein